MYIRHFCLAGLSFATLANAQSPAATPGPDKAAAQYVTSRDGTRIAYDKSGKGPAVIVVGGALSDRLGGAELASLLAPQLTVYSYDRRGRGDSTDTPPYSVKREIEDIEALITAAGGTAFVYGKSSGAALALHAAADLGRSKVKKLALYEAPYSDADGAAAAWRTFRGEVDQLLAANRREDAIAHFMKFVGAPDDAVAGMKASPAWRGMLAMAPTLAYDNTLLGEDRSVPVAIAARIKSPTLVMDGDASAEPMPFMRATADQLGKTIPNAQRLTVEGQAHDVSAKVLAPILLKFFTAPPK
jgi:pimeloyl-ACP methyl ester carboxylesterase